MQSAISWFEIPTLNLAKAKQFYEAVLQCALRPENMGPSEGAVFPYDEAAGGVGGALMCGPSAPVTATGAAESGTGVLIYSDGGKHSVDSMLRRAVVLVAAWLCRVPLCRLDWGLLPVFLI